MQLIHVTLDQLRPMRSAGAREKWLKPIRRRIDRIAQRGLVAGNFLTFGMHGVALAPGADERLAWHGVAEVLYRVRQSEKLVASTDFLMIKDLHAPFTSAARVLEDLSYRYIETEPDMVLSIDPSWKSYDDYLGSLSAKYRGNARTGILKPIDEGGCRIVHVDDIESVEPRLYELYLAIHQNADIRPFVLRSNYFSALRAAAGKRFRCSAIERDHVLLGFLVTIADGDTALAYHIGMDREAAKDLPLYLRLLHTGIADAIELGCRQLSYGRTALEPKAALGARPREFGVLARHRQPVVNKLIKQLLTGIEHASAPERNPFKKKSPA